MKIGPLDDGGGGGGWLLPVSPSVLAALPPATIAPPISTTPSATFLVTFQTVLIHLGRPPCTCASSASDSSIPTTPHSSLPIMCFAPDFKVPSGASCGVIG